jgi:hypothetical protein
MPGGAVVAPVDVEVDAGVLATLVRDREGLRLAAIGRLGRTVGSPVGPETGRALDPRAVPASAAGSSRSCHASLCRPEGPFQVTCRGPAGTE